MANKKASPKRNMVDLYPEQFEQLTKIQNEAEKFMAVKPSLAELANVGITLGLSQLKQRYTIVKK